MDVPINYLSASGTEATQQTLRIQRTSNVDHTAETLKATDRVLTPHYSKQLSCLCDLLHPTRPFHQHTQNSVVEPIAAGQGRIKTLVNHFQETLDTNHHNDLRPINDTFRQDLQTLWFALKRQAGQTPAQPSWQS